MARSFHGPEPARAVLRAHEPGVQPGSRAHDDAFHGDDFILAIAGIWQIEPDGDWQTRVTRLLDLVMDGLRAGSPGRP